MSLPNSTFSNVKTAPVAAVDAFHQALAKGDPAGALALLAPNLVVCEFGVIDPTRDAYAFAHLPIDMSLAMSARWTLKTRKMGGTGDQRWVVSSYRVVGTGPDGSAVDQIILETMILQRSANTYSISHIHWSAYPSAPGKA